METITETTERKFSTEWWDNFLDTTQHQSKTAVFKDCVDKRETTLMRACVLEILRNLAVLRTSQYGYRVYIDGTILTSDEMERIYDSPPLTDETMETWVERVFGDRKFGMIINMGEKFNSELSTLIALKLAPLLKEVGFPRDGINFTLFIGNYDKTPLGIHKDPAGQNVIHFHLGPGGKTMYTWDKAEYEAMIESKEYERKDVERLLPFATEFSFEEGDLYFMPEGVYHIGKQEGLSLSITAWQYNLTKEKVARKLHRVLLTEILEVSEDLLKPDINDLSEAGGLDEILEKFKISSELDELSYKDLLREVYRDFRCSIHSNAGYRSSMFPKEEDSFFNLEDTIELERPFKIIYKESANSKKLHVFVRGIKIEFNNFNCIKNLLDKVNEGNPHRVVDLLSLLDTEWDLEIGLYILKMIYVNHGVRKVNAKL